jgi:predicted transcriptional regulator
MAKELDLIKILSQKNQEDYGNISIHRMGDNRLMIRKNTHGSKPIIINRHIPICNLLFEGLGLWSGDGWKKEVLGFSNSEIKLIRHFIKFCNLLGIQRSALNWDLQLITAPNKIDEIIKIYSKKIKLKKIQFRNYIVQKRNYNCIRVYKHSWILPIFINAIFNCSLPFITKDIQFGASYLKGVFATDGWVTLREKLDTTKHVGIAVQSHRFKKIFIRVFARLGINHQTNDKGIYISSHEDFIKLERLGLLELHPKKKKKFRRGLRRFCSEYGKNKYKTLLLLTSHNRLSAYELANLIQITPRSARRIFQQLQRENYVRYKEKRNRHIYLITRKGRNLFKEDKDIVLLRLAYLKA